MKRRVVSISIIVLIIGIIIGIILYLNSDYKLNLDRKNNIESVGSEYYENYYYPSVGEDYIKKYMDNSIKIPLSTISNSKDLNSKIKDKLFDKCDVNNTYIEITPVSPFKSDSYKIKVNLDC